VTQFAVASVPHWEFPRNAASIGLLVSYGREQGLADADLFRATGLDPAIVDDPTAMVAARQELQVAQNLTTLLGDRAAVALEIGTRYRISTFGMFGYACLTSPTVGSAIAFALKYYDLSYGFCLPRVSLEGGEAVVRFDIPGLTGPIARFMLERDLAAIRVVLDDMLGSRLPFTSMRLAYPKSAGPYRRIFGLAPVFNAAETEVRFDATILERPLPQANDATVELCEAQCRDIVARSRNRSGFSHEVRELLVNVGRTQRSIAEVAHELAVSERTLRRRLAEEGTSFRALVDEVQHPLACELLASGALSVDDVAIRLGYAEASSFIVAFKRWHGMTPARFARSASRPRAALA